jgi:hypothetical protein
MIWARVIAVIAVIAIAMLLRCARGSAVGTATGYGLDDRGDTVPVPVRSRPALGHTQPASQWVPGGFSPGIKRQGREVNHSQRMVSSGMLRLVALVRTDVSEELSVSFIRVTRIGD